MKLTKNEVRFSKLVRPAVGDVVEFDPVVILVKGVVVADTRKFTKPYMVAGAKCTVDSNWENTVYVKFVGQEFIDIISPEYLIKRDLTDQAIRALNKLKARLGIIS